jgi:hypothetical protein
MLLINVHEMNSRASYVDILKCRADRSTLAKLRLSSHKLEVERGRHIGVEHNKRICKLCNSNNVENETHFLWEHERESFYNKLLMLHNYNYKLIYDDCLRSKLLMNSKSYKVLKCLSKFIVDMV